MQSQNLKELLTNLFIVYCWYFQLTLVWIQDRFIIVDHLAPMNEISLGTEPVEVSLAILEVILVANKNAFFPREIENILVEIILLKTKPPIVWIIYRPPNQINFLQIINANFDKHHLTPTTSGNNTSDAKNNIKTVAILGDSMIIHISGWEISKKLLKCI